MRKLYKRACNRCLSLEGDRALPIDQAILSELRAVGSWVNYDAILESMPYLNLRTLVRASHRLLEAGFVELMDEDSDEPRKLMRAR